MGRVQSKLPYKEKTCSPIEDDRIFNLVISFLPTRGELFVEHQQLKKFLPVAMLRRFLLLLLVLVIIFTLTSADDYVTYETNQGNVRGVIKKARNGATFNAFLGVPFARPPLGVFRWQPPQPAPIWEGILDATKRAQVCTQDDLYHPDTMLGSEDCLYLNVFTKGKGKLGPYRVLQMTKITDGF